MRNETLQKKESQETTQIRSLAKETNAESTMSDHLEFSTQISETYPIQSSSSNSQSLEPSIVPPISENKSKKVSTTSEQTRHTSDTTTIDSKQAEEKTDQSPSEESPSLESDPTRKVSSPKNKGSGTAGRAPNDPREVRRRLEEESTR